MAVGVLPVSSHRSAVWLWLVSVASLLWRRVDVGTPGSMHLLEGVPRYLGMSVGMSSGMLG